MIAKIGKNHYKGQAFDVYLLTGNAGRDAETKPINGKPHSVFSVAAQENQDSTTLWVNVNGWRNMYGPVAAVRKGDSVLAVGQLKKREYNGKTYYDLDAEYLSVAGSSGGAIPVSDAPTEFAPIDEEDCDLPF